MSATDGVSGENVHMSVTFEQEVLPAHHHSHGTPDPMVRRWVEVEVDGSRAALEQTDYGHPGRFNPPQLSPGVGNAGKPRGTVEGPRPGACGLGELGGHDTYPRPLPGREGAKGRRADCPHPGPLSSGEGQAPAGRRHASPSLEGRGRGLGAIPINQGRCARHCPRRGACFHPT